MPRPRLRHLALAVRDQARSRQFYERYFGFDGASAQRYPDGVLILRHADDGFSLALGEVDEDVTLPPFLHIGFDLGAPEAVRALRDRLRADGVAVVEENEEELYVSCKCFDPDGYVVEAAWEIPRPTE
jgi:catechol 2,3-dioxygenase-like lactoylglutathione lyase family enzyme